jgi:hypothetical protein
MQLLRVLAQQLAKIEQYVEQLENLRAPADNDQTSVATPMVPVVRHPQVKEDANQGNKQTAKNAPQQNT